MENSEENEPEKREKELQTIRVDPTQPRRQGKRREGKQARARLKCRSLSSFPPLSLSLEILPPSEAPNEAEGEDQREPRREKTTTNTHQHPYDPTRWSTSLGQTSLSLSQRQRGIR